METRASYALIGASLLAGLAALAAFVVWLGQVQFTREFASYNVVFDGAVNGLSQGGQVRYLGINVGEVTDLSLDRTDPTRVIARIRIDAETPVRVDSKAILDFAGLTGVTFIQIQPGQPGSDLLPKRTGTGDDLPRIETELTQLAEIFEGGQDLLSNAQITLSRLNEVLNAENVESFQKTLAHIEQITGVLAGDEELIDNATQALGALAEAGQAVGKAADAFEGVGSDIRVQLNDISKGAQALIGDARKAMGVAQDAVAESQKGLDETRSALQEPAVVAVEEVRLLAQDLRLLIHRLDRIARDVEQNPQSFIQGSPKPYKEGR